ncbi:MAG: helix-turn-helix domain-containing protein [Oribacterium sp.]|nr:helix-turn-helix domain-containing protein [Oribacterium sp.]
MNLHLNTVKYRINQLEKTFGIDFTKMDAIYVSLAAAKIWIG